MRMQAADLVALFFLAAVVAVSMWVVSAFSERCAEWRAEWSSAETKSLDLLARQPDNCPATNE